jgi:hypothetical protein
MAKTSDGDVVICVGRESIEALATGEPVCVGPNEYLLQADSYDHPYKRIDELEAALTEIRDILPLVNDEYARRVFAIAANTLEPG